MAEDKKDNQGTEIMKRSIPFGSAGTQNTSNTNTGKANSGDSGNKSSTKDSNAGESEKK